MKKFSQQRSLKPLENHNKDCKRRYWISQSRICPVPSAYTKKIEPFKNKSVSFLVNQYLIGGRECEQDGGEVLVAEINC